MSDKLNSYIWKDKKVINSDDLSVIQNQIKMIDMSEQDLVKAYQHCKNMLYNNSKVDPGRYSVLTEINQQINNCTDELAIRWFCSLEDESGNIKYSRFTLLNEIKTVYESIKSLYGEDHIFKLQDIYSQLPPDFRPITIDSVIKGCKDTLGKFNKKHITKIFIIKQGIWFTPEEIRDFKEIEKLKSIDEILSKKYEKIVNFNTIM